MTSEIQQQQLDTPAAPEAATGVTIRRKRHLVGRYGTRCQGLQHPIFAPVMSFFFGIHVYFAYTRWDSFSHYYLSFIPTAKRLSKRLLL